MAATEEQLKRVAELKIRLRQTDPDVAAVFGVSPRTIQRWLNTAEYAQIATAYRESQKDSARSQVAGLADEIIENLASLMRSSKSDLVRMQSAATLGRWLGLETLAEDEKEDDRESVKALMLLMASNAQPFRILAPPKPGGSLPDPVIDATEITYIEEPAEE